MRSKEHESESDVRREMRKPISPQRIARSWAAGIIDNGVRLHVMYAHDLRRTNINLLIITRTRALARDVREIIGVGKVRPNGGRWELRLTCKEVLDSLQPMIGFFSPGSVAREYIRVCATWATTFHVRAFGEQLHDSIVELRARLVSEIKSIRAAQTQQRTAERQEPLGELDGGAPLSKKEVEHDEESVNVVDVIDDEEYTDGTE